MSAPSSAEVNELLARVPVFSTLDGDDLQRIAQLAVPRSFAAGQVVFREGDASDTCYIVHRGRTRAVHQHGDGRTITLATFGPGDIFGELALFEDERRSATIEALEPTSVVAVLGPDMRRLMSEHPQIAVRLVIALGRRLREANARLARRSFQSVQSRVASVLAELVEQAQAEAAAGQPGGADAQPGGAGRRADIVPAGETSGYGGGVPVGGSQARDVAITATQADLAKLAGSSRESASRFLAVLERAGVISQGRGRLVVHDPQALLSYVF
ncbi:MAG TPA: Crp/Fnr family transcriptional regulator [Solirubrobacteraceae bacterium]|nr:Crp/Fnr family transcriptional regulator [Solirubrobacteraceae bacterium]